ncbi:NB-ARC domain-containing protein [Lentzea sp. BCCO 10_0798]|uniref:NB-ARC domain-containing protein n=1 Tax=Lentzea kristufekii TaxID=3095430 RepID=A0ABU4TRR1_9PSEU|nr:NB-ARC domain-containing protein [Lentzea sp. BCCO 10_0798]MDX8050977.1 NB-ARC domain-containing protein [Lentzea sp. BCCO 10_0798]
MAAAAAVLVWAVIAGVLVHASGQPAPVLQSVGPVITAGEFHGAVTTNMTICGALPALSDGVSDGDGVVWNIPAPVRTLSGRDDELAVVADLLQTTDTRSAVALHGMPGVGKTQLAFACADGVREDTRIGWLVPSATRLVATAALAELASLLGVGDQDQETAARRVVIELRGREKWLLLFDNVSLRADIADLVPDGSGRVLITSVEPDWGTVAEGVPVEPLTEDHGIAFLVTRSGDDDREAATDLTRRLGGLPLALEQVGAYCRQTVSSLAHYRELFDSNRTRLLQQGIPENYRLPVVVTLRLSIRRAEQRSVAAVQLLRLLAFLHPVGDPRDIVADIRGTPLRLRMAIVDPMRFNVVVNVLVSLSLLTRDEETDRDLRSLAVHEHVQATPRAPERHTAQDVALDRVGGVEVVEQHPVRRGIVLLEHPQQHRAGRPQPIQPLHRVLDGELLRLADAEPPPHRGRVVLVDQREQEMHSRMAVPPVHSGSIADGAVWSRRISAGPTAARPSSVGPPGRARRRASRRMAGRRRVPAGPGRRRAGGSERVSWPLRATA